MISQDRYIKIISGTGAANAVAERKLGMRVITLQPALPPGIVVEFESADAVGTYFGFTSEEYRRAAAYFGFVSKAVQKPSSMSFARWANTAVAPMIVGDMLPKSLDRLKLVSGGTLTLIVGVSQYNISGINLTSASSMGGVATLVQAAIRGTAGVPANLATCTVTWSSDRNQFTLTGGTPGVGTIQVVKGASAETLDQLLGWTTSGAFATPGQAQDTIVNAVAKATSVSNNFGSLVVTTFAGLTIEQQAAIAEWNHARNNQYVYSVAVPMSSLTALYDLVKGFSGTALNIKPDTVDDFIEQSPCEIIATLNYNLPGAAQNFMFYRFPSRQVTVSDDAIANLADAQLANYIGLTQVNGQQLAFYQRGVLCGGANDATDMSVYVNEIWLKSALTAAFMSLFLELGSIQPNPTGASYLIGAAQPILNTAANNGTFSVGKELDSLQKAYISQVTGDALAWRQVETLGYWLDITFSRTTNPNNGRTEYKANYRLIYSKGDSVRSVDGQDIMI